MRFHVFAFAALHAGSSVALAQDAQEDEAPEVQAAQVPVTEDEEGLGEPDPGEEVVCRRERVTGSLTRVRRTCLTRNEWAQVEANTRDDMIRSGRNASGGMECKMDAFGGC